ncbi:MAG TPA: hypothetical protein HA283_03880 [Nanoarchaeota archaeon]|nr:hypothetical protein [Nanoarchaeota archaeon]HIJ09826.1 hypothetical protein [Nanoarchaeota archaeon]HLD54856.1 hypothetical protein [Candidatus Nanoarchaeia archaeon]
MANTREFYEQAVQDMKGALIGRWYINTDEDLDTLKSVLKGEGYYTNVIKNDSSFEEKYCVRFGLVKKLVEGGNL